MPADDLGWLGDARQHDDAAAHRQEPEIAARWRPALDRRAGGGAAARRSGGAAGRCRCSGREPRPTPTSRWWSPPRARPGGQGRDAVARRRSARSAEATHDRLGGPGGWTLALPAHYVAGLMVVARATSPGRRLVRSGPTCRSGRPRRCRRAALPLAGADPAVRALTDPVLTEALAGSTPSCSAGPGRPDVLRTGPRRRVERGHDVRDERDLRRLRLRRHPAGRGRVGRRDDADDRIELAGAMLFSGYRLRPDLTAEAWRRPAADHRRPRRWDR